MAAIWAGIDAGKTHHHCVAIDESGRRLLSRRVANDEPELLEIRGNLRRPQRYNRRLQRVLYTSALFSIRHCEESRRFYDRKRAEGKRHTQAVLALARRRVNVLWALLHDGRCYEPAPSARAAA
ncbi:transposase [Streptomyces sp. NBC_00631]